MFKTVTRMAFAIGLAALMPLVGQGQAVPDLVDLIAQIEPSVVRIETEDGLGSGFVTAADGTVVTNFHVIAGNSSATIHFADGKSFDVIGVLAMDEDRDLAVLSTAAKDLPALPIATELPRRGVEVVTFGAPAGLSFSTSTGIISAIREGNEPSEQMLELSAGQWLQTTAPISPGNSGGPLVNRQGMVVGANTFHISGGQNLNFAISCIDINEMLALAVGKEPIPLEEAVGKIQPREAKPVDPELVQQITREYLQETREFARTFIAIIDTLIDNADEELRLTSQGTVDRSLPLIRTGHRRLIRGGFTYVFPSEALKRHVVEEATDELNRLLDDRAKMSDHGAGLVYIATHAGPPLSLTTPGSLGSVASLRVLQILGDDHFIGEMEDRTKSQVVVSVVGIDTRAMLTDHVVGQGLYLFSGIELVKDSEGTELRIARIQHVPKKDFARWSEPLAAEFKPREGTFREWTDLTGKFRVSAELIGVRDSVVTLRRESGEVIKVPTERLSLEDRKRLRPPRSPRPTRR